jgi:predicted transcriptional regulator
MTDSIITEKLARRGLSVRHIYEFNPLRQTRVSSIMSPVIAVDSKERVMEVFRLMNLPDHHFMKRKKLVVLKDGIAVGMVDRPQLFRGASNADSELTVEQVASKSFLTIREDEFGFEALTMMTLNDVPFLIVIDKNNKAVGYISRGDLIKAQKDKIADDTIVEKGLWARLFN